LSSRLSSLWKTAIANINRGREDKKDVASYIDHHGASLYTSRGYLQWQGLDAQRLLKLDISQNFHETKGCKALYESQSEYFQGWPIDVFRQKFNQEICTGKYLHTLKVRGKFHKAS